MISLDKYQPSLLALLAVQVEQNSSDNHNHKMFQTDPFSNNCLSPIIFVWSLKRCEYIRYLSKKVLLKNSIRMKV